MTAALIPTPVMQFLDADGNPLVGGKVYTYAAGTSTPLATYTDYGGATPNANPVILNSRGEASIWFGTAAYKLELYTAANVLIWTADNVSASTPVVYGTGVAAALAINVGTAGSILVNGGALVGTTLSASGTATMAAINASGKITSTLGNNQLIFDSASATTGYQQMRIINTSGSIVLGVENSTGGAAITGDTAYDATIAGASGIAFSANNGSAMQMRLASTGLAVTGTLSVSGTSTLSSTVTFGAEGKIAQNGSGLDLVPTTGRSFRVLNAAMSASQFSVAEATGNTLVGGTLGVTGVTTIGSVSSGIALAVTSSAATYTGSFINSAATSAGLLVKAGSTSGHEVLDVQSYNATSLLKVVASGAVTIPGTLGVSTGAAVGGATPGAGGLAFPATAVAVADANTLDDYEEGTWTPVITGSTIAGTGTYSVQNGRYTKIGNTVRIYFAVNWSAHTGTGTTIVTGFPFSSNAGDQTPFAVFTYGETFAALNVANGGFMSNGTTQWQHWQVPTGGGNGSGISIYNGTAEIQVSGVYQTS